MIKDDMVFTVYSTRPIQPLEDAHKIGGKIIKTTILDIKSKQLSNSSNTNREKCK